MTEETPSEFIKICRSTEFRSAWHAIVQEPIRHEDFVKMPPPEDLSIDDLWECFTLLRYELSDQGGALPWFKTSGADESWMFLPKSAEQDLERLSIIAGPDCKLNDAVTNGGALAAALLKNASEEIIACARLDGFTCSHERMRSVWLGESSPASKEEQVIARARQLYDGTQQYAKRRFSLGSIELLFDHLDEGVDDLDLARHYRYRRECKVNERVDDPEFVESVVRGLVTKANQCSTMKDVILELDLISSTFWDLDVFPRFNALVEYLVRRIFLYKQRLPALANALLLASESSGSIQLDVESHQTESVSYSVYGLDYTWAVIGRIKLLLAEMTRLEKLVNEQNVLMRNFRMNIMKDPRINRRQRDFLLLVQANPNKPYSLNEYLKSMGVAYATARKDLLDLTEYGYLTMKKNGRAFTFALAAPPPL